MKGNGPGATYDQDQASKGRVRIAHDFDDLPDETDGGIILTLQDQPIIGTDPDKGTVLENAAKTADYRREFHKNLQEKLRGAHDPHDDFFRGKILPKYDEAKAEKEGIWLDDQGRVEDDAAAALSRISGKLGISNEAKGVFDLEVRKGIQSDYMTEQEFRGFTKKKKKANEKKSSIRDFSFLHEVDEEAEEGVGRRQIEDEGAREHRYKLEEEAHKSKLDKYSQNMRKTTESIRAKSHFEDSLNPMEEEDTYALQQMIINSHRAAEEKSKLVTDRLSRLLERPTDQPSEIIPDADFLGSLPSKGGSQLTEVARPHSDLEKIVQSIKANEDPFHRPEKKKKLTLADQASGYASVIDVMLPSELLRNSIKERDDQEEESTLSKRVNGTLDKAPAADGGLGEPNYRNEEEGQDDSESEEEDALALKGASDLGRSTFAALDIMRQKGLLRQDKNNVYVGRNNDQKLHQKSEKIGSEVVEEDDDGPQLEYRDKSGHLMTKKQAFRYMCWTFHNKRPSKIKQAKMAQKVKAHETAAWSDQSKLITSQLLAASKEATQKPYVNLTELSKRSVGGGPAN